MFWLLAMRELPEQKWNRIQKKLQQAILTSYPNPDRNGCPGDVVLADLARLAAEQGTLEGDPQWEHVTHCSPCYKEYLEARDRLRKSAKDDSEAGARE
jgi:hypothetical protein